jgi:predicted phospho-2-dehydro-3-deoxyheptonate aldolase
MSEIGKKIRLGRILNQTTGKTVIIAMDHAIGHGVIKGIDCVHDTMEKVIKGEPNAITIHKGIAEYCFNKYAGKTDVALILKVTSFSPYHPTRDALVATAKEAVALGADGVAVGATVGGIYQFEMLQTVGNLAKECRRLGMPLLAHIYPKGEAIEKKAQFATENVCYAARTAAEIGVDIVKTWYTGDSRTFKRVVECCPVPVVIAGGPKLETPRDVLDMIKGGLMAGAAGVTLGRNAWQCKDPTAMIRAVKKIVHEDANPEDAMGLING